MHRPIGISGVCSQLGLMTDDLEKFSVKEDRLIDGLMRRFGATRNESLRAIDYAIENGVIKRENGHITLIKER